MWSNMVARQQYKERTIRYGEIIPITSNLSLHFYLENPLKPKSKWLNPIYLRSVAPQRQVWKLLKIRRLCSNAKQYVTTYKIVLG